MKLVRHYITFRPVAGIFENAIQPYKKWYQMVDMSLPIEVDGNYYHILRTTGPIDRVSPKKVVVCDEDAVLIEDEEISRKCFRFYIYLGQYEFANKKLKADLKQDGAKRYNPIIPEYKKMMTDLAPVLNESETEAMAYHLFYFEEIIRITTLRIELVEKLFKFKEQLRHEIDKVTNTMMEEIMNTFHQWLMCSSELQAVLYEDGLRARGVLRRLLKDPKNKQYIKDEAIVREILDDLAQGEAASTRLLRIEKEQRKAFAEWIDLGELDQEVSNMEKLIKELRCIDIEDKSISANLEELMEEYWAFGSSC